MSRTPDNITDKFEQQLSELETIVSRMEQGELTLESSIKEFEQGMKLANECQKTLEAAEMRVKVLMTDKDGNEELVDFTPDIDPNP